MKLNSEMLTEALNLEYCPTFEATGISIDSRNIQRGDIFFAIKGNNFDGNAYATEALNKGAVLAIIGDPSYKTSDKMIVVEDTTETLKKLGLYVKNKVGLKKVIGITGSVGKTTTRSWLLEVLGNFHKAFSSIKNYNTIYGLPISLSLMDPGTEFGVFELGTSSPGEISELSCYLEPDVAIITNIYESHICGFGSKQHLASEKISIIDGMNAGGFLIYDGDSEFREEIKQAASQKHLTLFSVGFSENCDFRVMSSNEYNIVFKTPQGIYECKLGCNARHFSYIGAGVVACLYALGLNFEKYLECFEKLSPLKGRGEVSSYSHKNKKFKVIDDSYNASPSAMIAAIDRLSAYGNRRIAIIGQMLELGEHTEHYHRIIAEKIKTIEIDSVFFIGDSYLHSFFEAECFESIDNFAIEKILEIIENDDIVLLKGSNSIRLNRFVDYIK